MTLRKLLIPLAACAILSVPVFAGGPVQPPGPQPITCGGGNAVTAYPGYGQALTCGAPIAGGTIDAGAAPQIGQYTAANTISPATISGDATLAAGGALTVSKIGGKAVTLGGAFTTSGAFATTLTVTNTTGVTLPTSGTLATLAGAETFTNKTLTAPIISSISNTGTLTLPTSADTLVGRATTDTLTNKTLTSPTIAAGALSGTFSGTPTLSGNLTFSGAPIFTGLSAGTIAAGKNLGLDSSNNLVTATVAGGSGLTVGSSSITSGTDGRLFYDNAGVLGEAIVGSGLSLSAGTLSASGGSAAGVGVQAGQSPSNIGDNTTALPSGHYYYATNVAMTAQRTHNLPDSATQGAGDLEVFDAKQTATATNQLCVSAAGTDKVNTVTNGTVCITTAGGSIYLHNDGAGEYTTGAATNIPAPTNAQLIVGKTGSPSNTLAAVSLSQDCTITNAGVITCTKTNNVALTALATTTPGTGIATALGVNVGSAGAPVLFNGALGTPSSGTGTNITGIPDNNVLAVTLATGTSVSLTAPREYYICTGTCTVTPPVPAAGYEFCVMNDDNVATVITLAAIGSSARYEATARTSYGTAGTGTFVSGGAAGDKVCLLGRDSTHYLTASYNGTWTAN